MAKVQPESILTKRSNRPVTQLNNESESSLFSKKSVFPPLQDGQFAVVSLVRSDRERLMTVSKSKSEPALEKATRKKIKAKIQEKDTKEKSCFYTCANNKSTQSRSESTDGAKESEDRAIGVSDTQRKKTRKHDIYKPPRSSKTSSLDCAFVVNDLKKTCPRKGRETLSKSEELGFEDRYSPSLQLHVDSTHPRPPAAPPKQIRLPPLKDPLRTSSSLHSAVPPLTPNSILLAQKCTVSPIAQTEFAFDDNTRERKRHGKLPPLSLPQREPTFVVVPPTPTTKKPGSLPKLNHIRSQLSSSSSTTSNGEQSQFLSQSAPTNWRGERSVLCTPTPTHSSKSLEFSFPPCHTPSHFSYHSFTLSDSSLSSSLTSPSFHSPLSSSSAISSPFTYDGEMDEVFRYYPLPPPASSKKSNTQRRRRPGRRLVPLKKVENLLPSTVRFDSTSECSETLEDIEEVRTCSPKSNSSESELVDFEESELLKEYLRICPGRRGAMCEKLEKNMNVVKINGKKYNLTTLRLELTEMANAVKKYKLFFKTLKFLR